MSNSCASRTTTAHLKLLLSNKGQLVCQVGGVMAVVEIPLRIHEVGRSLSGRPTIPPLGAAVFLFRAEWHGMPFLVAPIASVTSVNS